MDNPYLNEWEEQPETGTSLEAELATKLRRVMLVSRFFAVGGLLFLIAVVTNYQVLYAGFGWAALLYLAALALNITQANIARSYRRAIYARGGLLDSLAKRARIGTNIAWVIVGLAPASPFIFFFVFITLHNG